MRTAITVKRLIELLGKLPPDGHVVRHQWEDCLGIYARGDGRILGGVRHRAMTVGRMVPLR